jgi:hypothetical protein
LKGTYFLEPLSEFLIKIPPEAFVTIFDHKEHVPSSSEIEAISHYMINIPEIQSKKIIEISVVSEVNSNEVSTLFRRNSLATKIIGKLKTQIEGKCMDLFGHSYLKYILTDLINTLESENIKYELDPSKTDEDSESLKKNMTKILEYSETLLSKIIISNDKLPP